MLAWSSAGTWPRNTSDSVPRLMPLNIACTSTCSGPSSGRASSRSAARPAASIHSARAVRSAIAIETTLEKHVGRQLETAHQRPEAQRLPEIDAGLALPHDQRRHRELQPIEAARCEEARHGHPAALDEDPGQAALTQHAEHSRRCATRADAHHLGEAVTLAELGQLVATQQQRGGEAIIE